VVSASLVEALSEAASFSPQAGRTPTNSIDKI
jgi:hypothetical protein